MRITDVETIALHREINAWGRGTLNQDIVLVKVHTDAGITGLSYLPLIQLWRAGDAAGPGEGSHARPVIGMIHGHLKRMLLGKDPFNVARLWEDMYYGSHRFNKTGVTLQCISVLEIAL